MDVKKLGILFLLFASVASAQTKTGPQPEQTPTIAPEVHAKVRDLQLEQAKITIRLYQIQAEANQLQQQSNSLTGEINGILAQAVMDDKVNPAKWKANADTLKYDAVPPKPEEKKEPPKKP